MKLADPSVPGWSWTEKKNNNTQILKCICVNKYINQIKTDFSGNVYDVSKWLEKKNINKLNLKIFTSFEKCNAVFVLFCFVSLIFFKKLLSFWKKK